MFTLSTLLTATILVYAGYLFIQWLSVRKSLGKIPRTPVTGLEALVGAGGEVVEAFTRSDPTSPARGRVRIGSELWQAELAADGDRLATVGEEVRVVSATDMLLKVKCR
jgi:membrane protein implicated in regulation of membrane protease activity